MEDLVAKIIQKLDNKKKQYSIEELEIFSSSLAIPKEFKSKEKIDEELEDELKAFTLGCELFSKLTKRKYDNNKLEDIPEIKEAGIYQFLQATLQDEVTSIISDDDYLKKLLELYGKDKEEFETNLIQCVVDRYSTVGLVRDINQDYLKISSPGNLFIVADGVGGGEHGEIASKKACETAFKYLNNKKYIKTEDEENIISDLKIAIMKANDAVIEYADKEKIDTIGTTLSIALIHDRKLFVGHVGDSRVYRIHKNKKPKSITYDHSLPEVLFRSDEITTEEEKKNYKKNILVYVIGKRDLKEENLHVFCAEEELTDDIILLCSDGVWDIQNIEAKFSDKAEDLKRYILDSIPSDNATFIRCKFNYKTRPIVKKEDSKENIEEEVKPNLPNNSEISKEEKINNEVNLIIEDEEKDKNKFILFLKENFNKVLLFLIGIFILGISSFVFTHNDIKITQEQPSLKNEVENNKTNKKVEPPIQTEVLKDTNSSNETAPSLKITESKFEKIEDSKDDEKIEQPSLFSINDNVVKKVEKEIKRDTSHISHSKIKKHTNPKNLQLKIRARIDTKTYTESDLITIGNIKIWFGKDFIKINKEGCFEKLKNVYRYIYNGNIENSEIIKKLKKIKFGTVKIGLHNNKSWIVVILKNNYKVKDIHSIKNQEYKEELLFIKKLSSKNRPIRNNPSLEDKKKSQIETQPSKIEIKHWKDSEGLYVGQTFIGTVKKNKITLNIGSCHKKGTKWVCVIPNKKIKAFTDITNRLNHQKFAEKIVLNSDANKPNVRLVITVKARYSISSTKENGKFILIFK